MRRLHRKSWHAAVQLATFQSRKTRSALSYQLLVASPTPLRVVMVMLMACHVRQWYAIEMLMLLYAECYWKRQWYRECRIMPNNVMSCTALQRNETL